MVVRQSGRQSVAFFLLAVLPAFVSGCAPTLDIAGVYVPGWLASAVSGVIASYTIVLWLGRRPGARSLADSGLLFVSLLVAISLAVWWALFSGF